MGRGAAGVRAIRQAWDAEMDKRGTIDFVDVVRRARDHARRRHAGGDDDRHAREVVRARALGQDGQSLLHRAAHGGGQGRGVQRGAVVFTGGGGLVAFCWW